MNGETSTEKLVNDLKTLIGDAEELLKATTNQAGEKIAVARQKIEQSLIEGKKALADADSRVRRQAAKTLGDIGAPARAAVPSLRKALMDADEAVRSEATMALEKIGA